MDEKLINYIIEGYNSKLSQLINTQLVLEAQFRIANERIETLQKEVDKLSAKPAEKK